MQDIEITIEMLASFHLVTDKDGNRKVIANWNKDLTLDKHVRQAMTKLLKDIEKVNKPFSSIFINFN